MYDPDFFVFRLKHLKGIGNIGLLKILQYYLNHPHGPFYCKDFIKISGVKKQYIQLFKTSYFLAFEELTYDNYLLFQKKYKLISILSDDYPVALSNIYNPPIALFCAGNSSILNSQKLAVIGTRKNTEYGRDVIDNLLPELIEKQITIVSGLARGNDTYAHKAAIRFKGKTIGVIGCGLDTYYPKENQRLQDYMMKNHLVISEYMPGTAPLPYHFPQRNRIIAGLSRGICVIEAKKNSGTWITAKLGLDEGRDIFAVPGPLFFDNSEGCLRLIQEGAKCVIKASDILDEWQDIK
ncbi:DNA-processing protein DprA [Vagococcus vulneris]|uniref:DNA protecting protein DprA n=1 Tax=Vagococcus vulneris TaxID=1977869 RepID=A0A430A219_9ENTE|nr:DNA-processing protein DprA [Vagococcus vulneris]RSU00447.1 DNA protecting protein DprA [Vagococcus vulneris]